MIDIFTTLSNCLFYYVMAVVCMQAHQAKSVTAANYFKSIVKIGFASILCCSGLTLIVGAIMIGRTSNATALILWILQLGLFLALQMGILYYAFKVVNALIEKLLEFHVFLTTYRQTPRSRIFKKNIPQGDDRMEAIPEAESFLEQSVYAPQSLVIQGQSRGKSVDVRKSILSTRFVYSENAKIFEAEVDENDNDINDPEA